MEMEIAALFLLILAILYIPYVMSTKKHGAPFVPMEPDVVERVMHIAKVTRGDTFYELGSGDGRLVIAAALRGANSIGVEIDFLRVLYSKIWIFLLRLKNAQVLHKNFFDINLSDADVVCTYLLPETNFKLERKLEKELKKGTRVVSVAFIYPNWEPVAIDTRGTIYGPIYLYVV